MKYLLTLLALSSNLSAAEFDVKAFLNKTYVTVGVGYKVQETKLYYTNTDGSSYVMNDPITARIDIGYQYSKNPGLRAPVRQSFYPIRKFRL